MLIVIANATIGHYFQGGGLWTWFLQYPLGLKQLGHRVFWLEVMPSSGNSQADRQAVHNFFSRLAEYGVAEDAAVAVTSEPPLRTLPQADFHGRSAAQIAQLAHDADLLWNFWYALEEPFLLSFRRRAFIDVDPGHLQICVALGACTLGRHDTYFTVGLNAGQPDCTMPDNGVVWHPFRPFVDLSSWPAAPDPGPHAAFSSVTQWTWEELHYHNRVLSLSKREAYLRYSALPLLARRRFELAANLGEADPSGDRALLARNRWELVDPHQVAATPAAYRTYIVNSRGEFACPKPIHLQLKTGWFSDRSVAYLASGRPVLAENTGLSDQLPAGRGLLVFSNLEEAAAAVAEVDGNYSRHSRAARELAESCFDARRCLTEMLSTCDI